MNESREVGRTHGGGGGGGEGIYRKATSLITARGLDLLITRVWYHSIGARGQKYSQLQEKVVVGEAEEEDSERNRAEQVNWCKRTWLLGSRTISFMTAATVLPVAPSYLREVTSVTMFCVVSCACAMNS
jgi:hypothetical protein